jgi:hypothetical protein
MPRLWRQGGPAWPGNLFDLLTMLCIRRAILDSLWARERSTVNSNRLEGVRYLGICRALGLEKDAYPPWGTFPVEDEWGMRVACAILIRSLDRGCNADTIQYETMRKLRSHLANFLHTCPGGIGSRFMGEEGVAGAVSNSPTNTEWFCRFMKGCHHPMGDAWMPDRPVTIDYTRVAEMFDVTTGRLVDVREGRRRETEDGQRGVHAHYRILCGSTRRRDYQRGCGSYEEILGRSSELARSTTRAIDVGRKV